MRFPGRPGWRTALVACFLLAGVASGCRPARPEAPEPAIPEAPALGAPRPATAAELDSLEARGGRLEPLTSLLISFRDSLVLEAYYHGASPERAANLKSASKSLISALVGIALRDSLLQGVDQPVAELLPEYFPDGTDPRRRAMTLHQVLSMTTGLEGTSFDAYGAWVSSRDWVAFALERPFACEPGTCMTYSTGNSHLMSAILTRVSGRSTLDYARRFLFDPMGIRLAPWDRDPKGIYLGGNNMALRPRDMVKFGALYLHRGRWEGRQLLPEDWIDRSWQQVATSRWNGHGYGYFWWIREWNDESVYFAWGYGGQYIFVVPRLELVVSVTSDIAQRRRGGNHNAAVHALLREHIIPAFREESNGAIGP